jgi:MoxR-like ATPase
VVSIPWAAPERCGCGSQRESGNGGRSIQEQYIVDLVIATREPQRYGEELARWISIGASPRATIALDVASRARAWLCGKVFVSPEDVQAVAPACLAHRVHLSCEAEAAGKTREDVVNAVLERVGVA